MNATTCDRLTCQPHTASQPLTLGLTIKDCTLALLLLLTITSAAVAGSESDKKKEADAEPVDTSMATIPDAGEPPVITNHMVTVSQQTFRYTAEAGMLPLLKEDGTPQASVFYVAYTLSTTEDTRRRPIVFCFNGGPGAAAVWLHLGGLAPRRALVHADGSLPPPPYQVVPNEHTILPAADLVFIDPVSTGFSRATKEDEAKQFYGKNQDIEAMAEFIRLYTARHKRWRSPKYLCGESYGVFRAAGLARQLQAKHGMFLNGLILVSGLVDYGTILSGPSNDLPYTLFLPSFTAVAHAHGRLAKDLQADRDRTLIACQNFAAGDYLAALHAGAALPATRRMAIANELARFTGLSPQLILDHDLRIDPATFREELLADQGLILGRFDGRITGRDGDRSDGTPQFDPSYEAALGPLASTMNAYVREELGFESDLPYRVLTSVSPWPQDENRYSNTASQLKFAMSQNPHLRVFVQTGICDLAVPFSSMRYSIDHLSLDPAIRDHVTYAEYESGHMMYLRFEDLANLSRDLRHFLQPPAATQNSRN